MLSKREAKSVRKCLEVWRAPAWETRGRGTIDRCRLVRSRRVDAELTFLCETRQKVPQGTRGEPVESGGPGREGCVERSWSPEKGEPGERWVQDQGQSPWPTTKAGEKPETMPVSRGAR